MKKILGILAAVMIVSTMFVNASDQSLANTVATSTVNAAAAENDTDCDNDLHDICYDRSTGVKYTDCDPSDFWDTCGDPVDTETLN